MSQNTDVSKVRKLGRGLSALLQTPVAVEVAPARPTPAPIETRLNAGAAIASAEPAPVESGGGGGGGGGVEHVAVELIRASPFQARKSFDEAPLKSLADSIRTAGVMQPIIVRAVKGADARTYELVAGERRWRAAKLAGLTRVPAIVRELGDEDAAEWGLIENVQREDLNAMDRAHALRMMSERFGLSHAKVAEKVGLERATVANLVRLTELEADVAELISAGALDAAHGKALLSMPSGAERVRIARDAARNDWSVRKIETEVKRALAGEAGGTDVGAGSETTPGAPDISSSAKRAVVLDLERRLSQQLGTKVHIQTSGKDKGKISIEFYGLDHFDGLMAKLGVK